MYTAMRCQRVYLVDRHLLYLEGIGRALDSQDDFEVVGQDSHSDTAYAQIQALEPDMVLCDTELPGRGAMTMAADLRRRFPAIKLVFLSAHVSHVCIDEAIRLRAHGYLLKSDSAEEIISLLRRIGAGETCYSEGVKRTLTVDGKTKTYRVDSMTQLTHLTERQLEILRQLARGHSVKDVARMMDISARSVESHKYRIMQKLGIHDRVELALFAVREGLIIP